MYKLLIKPLFFTPFLLLNFNVFSQPETSLEKEVVTKFISIDSLKKVQYLEDLLDSFPKKDYFVYYCYITRSGKGFVSNSHVWDNDNNRYNPPPGRERREMIPVLFEVPDRPVKPGQKYLFDRIFIRKFKDKNSSETWPSLELYITN